nr:sugar ABC transporter ATP-binding protein [uncultured Dethiosulfovibrio sp.]
MNEKKPFIELRNINKRFGGVSALEGVGLVLSPGEIHCLAGQNGSGKSTLIKIISGVYRPEDGAEIFIDGDLVTLDPAKAIGMGIQVIYQDLSIFPGLSVAENIGLGQYCEKGRFFVDKGRLVSDAKTAMSKIGISLPLRKKVSELSIADRQLVAICRALANDARLVIMDEPTASLTRTEVKALLSVVKELKDRDIAVVFVSHRLDEVIEVAERVTVLRDGKSVGVFEASELDDKKLATYMTGLEFDMAVHDIEHHRSVLLSVEGLSRQNNYKDVSFKLHRGEILGITGLLGSGRTELALSLFGKNPPDSGTIALEGKDLSLSSIRDGIYSGIGYVSEDRLTLGIVMDQSIRDNSVLTVLDRLKSSFGTIDGTKRDQLVSSSVQDLSVKVSDVNLPVRTLSGGNQQKVVLAKWLATKPKVLILDSPTVGVDIAAKKGIYDIVKSLAAKGMGIIMISDEIPEVYYNCHRIITMQRGRITGEYRPTEISEQDLASRIDEV